MKLESWMALAALGLSVMFVTLLLSFYNFLIGPDGGGPQRPVEPGILLLQEIFISAAPSLALAGFVYGMAKSYGTSTGGMLLIAAGVIMVIGMYVGSTMVPKIDDLYLVGAVEYAPYIFMAGGAGMAAVGAYLMAISGRRKQFTDLDSLR